MFSSRKNEIRCTERGEKSVSLVGELKVRKFSTSYIVKRKKMFLLFSQKAEPSGREEEIQDYEINDFRYHRMLPVFQVFKLHKSLNLGCWKSCAVCIRK